MSTPTTRPAEGAFKVYDLAEFLATEFPLSDWGGWRLNRQRRQLELWFVGDSTSRYEVYLDHCHTSAGVLDWIMQLAQKTWASEEVLAGLVHALNDVLDPQRNLIHRTEPLTKADLKRLIDETPRARHHRAQKVDA